MRWTLRFLGVILLLIVLSVPGGVAALFDDFEEESWRSFTHFHLGDQAWAGYVSSPTHGGTRAFHVDIHGYTIRDFGSAYGYTVFSTEGQPVVALRLSLYY